MSEATPKTAIVSLDVSKSDKDFIFTQLSNQWRRKLRLVNPISLGNMGTYEVFAIDINDDYPMFGVYDPKNDFLCGYATFIQTEHSFEVERLAFAPEYQGFGMGAKLYSWMILNGICKTLMSGYEQSRGGRATWEQLAKVPGIFVYGWDKISQQAFSLDPNDLSAEDYMWSEEEEEEEGYERDGNPDITDKHLNLVLVAIKGNKLTALKRFSKNSGAFDGNNQSITASVAVEDSPAYTELQKKTEPILTKLQNVRTTRLTKMRGIDLKDKESVKELADLFEEEYNLEAEYQNLWSEYKKQLPKPVEPEPVRTYQVPNTPAFKAWFEGSKVVDSKGVPLRAYHGSPKDFEEFATSTDKMTEVRGEYPNAFNKSHSNPDWGGALGSWFTTESFYPGNYDEGNAEFVAGQFAQGIGNDYDDFQTGANVKPVWLSIKNPIEYGEYEEFQDDRDTYKSLKEYRHYLESQGYDGILIRNSMTDGDVDRDDWVAFYPNQIKSAIGNSGEFDRNNQSITAASSKTAGYTAYVLTNPQSLLDKFPPKFPDVIAHHVTYQFGVPNDTPAPPEAEVRVVGYACDESLECVIVEVNGTTVRPDGGTFHITLSLDRGGH